MTIAERTRQHTTEADWNDSQHTGPGTLGGRYLRLFWHPICCSQDLLPGKSTPIRIERGLHPLSG